MILRPVSPASPIGPPTTKRPVGLTKYLVFWRPAVRGKYRPDDMLQHVGADLLLGDIRGVLGGDDHRIHAHRLAVFVLHRHLALAVGAQIGHRAIAVPRTGGGHWKAARVACGPD